MARLGGQRLPLRRLRRGVGRVAEQIELTCIAVTMAMSGRWRGMDISPIRVVRAQCCAGIPQLRWCARNRRHILQQRCQGGEHRNVNIGSGANTPGRAGRPIEHPGRNLQPSPGCATREAATENLSASLLNNLMNMDQASGPRMPRIKKLVLRAPVGVPPSCCTMTAERIDHWTKMHLCRASSGGSETSSPIRSWVDCITKMPGFDFRRDN